MSKAQFQAPQPCPQSSYVWRSAISVSPPPLQKLGPQLSESQLANMNGDAAKAFGNNLNADQVTIDHD